jgi:acyl carrier protein
MTGGYLCIPSEEERSSDIIGAISRMNVNTADLTPSFVSSMSPDDVPSLKRLTLGGEPLNSKVIKIWADRVHLINVYGTTECCVTSTVNANITAETSPSNIGHAVGAVTWIVDVEDSSRLVSIGAVGELLIEGPAIAAGYLNDPERTKKYFTDGLTWNSPHVRCPGRHYKTGDLASYNSDGTINYIGRKDTQIKHNDQRIELGEIEHHLLGHPDIRNALVMLPGSGPYKGHITALIELESLLYAEKKQDIKIVPKSELDDAGFSWHKISEHLRENIPGYMVPSSWIAIEKMPLHTSGKLDRSRLNAWLYGLPTNYRSQEEPKGNESQLIATTNIIGMDISKHVAKIVLDDPSSDNSIVGHDVKLADIGIDSIKLMSLAAFLKRVFAVSVPVPLLINHTTKISDVAKYIETAKYGKSSQADFSIDLLKEFSVLDSQLKAIQCRIGVVFLTGATGYLGTEILRQILRNPGVDKVIAHIKALNPAAASQRLNNATKSARWSTAEFQSKLEVWAGDLSKPKLGLTLDQWSQLETVDAIIHNGASVNWTSDFHALKVANVNSTFEILKIIRRARPPTKLVYVTGGRSFDESEKVESVLKKLSDLDGYSQTKFLSDQNLCE